MMSFAGYFHARFLKSVFFPVCLSYIVLFFPTVFAPDFFGVFGGTLVVWFDIGSLWGLNKMHKTLWFCLMSG